MAVRYNTIAFCVIFFNTIVFLIYSNNINDIVSQLNNVETALYRLSSDFNKTGTFRKALQWTNPFNKDDFFVIEPAILQNMLAQDDWEDIKWRFDLNDFSINRNSLTLGMLFDESVDDKLKSLIKQHNFTQKLLTKGRVPSTKTHELTHAFFNSNKFNLHVVVFHKVNSFWWIGKIPETELFHIREFNIQFGRYEAIYDWFELEYIGYLKFPKEIDHFLSQLPTSRYLACPPESHVWMENNSNVSISLSKINVTEQAIIAMKSLMKELKMEFWIACGTLLGWYRQCGVTPYTTDTDFSSWSKYLKGEPMTKQLKSTAPNHRLKLESRFGEAKQNIEYSFKLMGAEEKVDLFFIYPNETHFRIPYHIVFKRQFTYSVYPQYTLCSVQLLGIKLLAPCETEKVIVTEYGPTWRVPISNWTWYSSPKNSDPPIDYVSAIPQYEEF